MSDHARELGIDGITDPQEVGRGGFAVVYRARQEAFRRDVAVKVIQAHPDSDTIDRFTREAVAMGALAEHPAILPLYDAGTTADGRPYLLMPFMSGGSYQDALDGGIRLSWREGFEVGVVLASALQAAHGEGILHRDLKPANVLLGRYGDPVLADFGIARVAGGPETASGVVTASLAHAAPEILDGQRPTVASDVYGLTSTIFALIHGSGPHVVDGEESVLPLITRTMTDAAPLLPGVPAVVNEVLQSGMAKDPAERPASAAELGTLLGQALKGPAVRHDRPAAASKPAADPATPAAPATARVSGPPAGPGQQDSVSPITSRPRWLLPAGLLLLLVVVGGGVLLSSSGNDGGDDEIGAGLPGPATESTETVPTDTTDTTDGTESTNTADSSDAINTAEAIDLPPQTTGSPREDPNLTNGVDLELITRWATTPVPPNTEALPAGRVLSIPLPGQGTTARTFNVQQGQVIHLSTSGSQVDPALGLFAAGGLFLAADDDRGGGETGAESQISFLAIRGGRQVVHIANLDEQQGRVDVHLALVDPAFIAGPTTTTATIDSTTMPVAALRFSVGAPGPGGNATAPIRSLQVTSEDLDPQITVIDERGRVRGSVSGNGAAQITLDQLRMGQYAVVLGSDDEDYAGTVTLTVS